MGSQRDGLAADPLSDERNFWRIAQTFPTIKEDVYPDHARAHGFDTVKDGEQWLEYGCGGGSDTMSLIRRGAFVLFADICHDNVTTTEARVAQGGFVDRAGIPRLVGCTIRLAHSSDLECVPTRRLDAVTSHGVLHHIPHPDPVLSEFYRVLKPDGRLYVMLYTEYLFERFLHHIPKLVADRGITPGEAFGWCTDGEGCPYSRYYTEEFGCMLLERAGFEVIDTVVYNNRDFRTFQAIKR